MQQIEKNQLKKMEGLVDSVVQKAIEEPKTTMQKPKMPDSVTLEFDYTMMFRTIFGVILKSYKALSQNLLDEKHGYPLPNNEHVLNRQTLLLLNELRTCAGPENLSAINFNLLASVTEKVIEAFITNHLELKGVANIIKQNENK